MTSLVNRTANASNDTAPEFFSFLIGAEKCALTLVLVLLATAVGGKTDTLDRTAAQAEVTLPAPTGPHKTGRMSFHWKDVARTELEAGAPDDKRELMAHLFYPADAKTSGARAPYVPDTDAMRGP